MWNIKISGFSDEACESFEEQLKFMNKSGVEYIELRTADGKNISELSKTEVLALKDLLDKYGIGVSAIGSPIGKISITDPFEPHLQVYRRVIETAKTLGTKYIRMFSFFIPKGDDPLTYRDEVLKRLKAFIDIARAEGIILLHENEKEIYGDNAERCLDIMQNLNCDNFRAVFDFANFIQVGQNTIDACSKLAPYVEYIHIKDAVGQQVVPAGMGDGMVKEILNFAKKMGYKGFLSLEPHLADFSGFAKLENGNNTEGKTTDGKFAWTIALNSLKAILYDLEQQK